ncbi:hypothetical protein HDU98_011378 [Podochytrium sp. JEL0797]|nr:hypothetical protein HDU98_011378 [Podochytrium sp. JEL0797]
MASAVTALRTHTKVFHRNYAEYSVPLSLNAALSRASLVELNDNAAAREALDAVATRDSTCVVSVAFAHFERIAKQTSHKDVFAVSPVPSHANEVLAVPALVFLLPFPALLADFLRANKTLLNEPAFLTRPLKYNDATLRVAEFGEATPFAMSLWGNHPQSALLLVSLGCPIALPTLAAHIMKYAWSPTVTAIVTEFVKRATTDPVLWKSTDPNWCNATFLGMLARVDRGQLRTMDPQSVKHLHAFLDQFLAHDSGFATRCDTIGRDPLGFAIHNGHKALFDWILLHSPRKVDLKPKEIRRLMQNGLHESLQWRWKDGTLVKSIDALKQMHWQDPKGKVPQEEKAIAQFIAEVAQKLILLDKGALLVQSPRVVIYGLDLVHLAIKHADSVQFLIDIGEVGRPLKVMIHNGPKFAMSATELALNLRQDDSALLLLRHHLHTRQEYVIERIRYLHHHLHYNSDIKLPHPTQQLIRYFAQHPHYKIVLRDIIPNLPFLLHSKYHIPVEDWSYLFADEGTAFNVNAILLDPVTKASMGTLLHLATEVRDVAFIESLVDYNADLSIRDAIGRTALHIAAALYEPEAAASSSSSSPPSIASNEFRILQILARNPDSLLSPDVNNLMPIMIAKIKSIIAGLGGDPPKDAFFDEMSNVFKALTNSNHLHFNYWKAERGALGGCILHDLARLFISLAGRKGTIPPDLRLEMAHMCPIFSTFSKLAESDCRATTAAGAAEVPGLLLQWDVNHVNSDNCTALDLLERAVGGFEVTNQVDAFESLKAGCDALVRELGLRTAASLGKSVIAPSAENSMGNVVKRALDPRLKQRASYSPPPASYTPIPPRSDPPPPPDLLQLIKDFHLDRALEYTRLLSPDDRRKVACRQTGEGDTVLHLLAQSPRTCTHVEMASITALVLLLVQPLSGEERGMRNREGVTALALSVFEDAMAAASGGNGGVVKSDITDCLERLGVPVVGVDEKGRSVVHGLVQTFLSSCLAQQRVNLKLDSYVPQVPRVVGAEAVASSILAFLHAGVDVNLLESQGFTAMDLLCAEAGGELSRLAGTGRGKVMDWVHPKNSGLAREREVLVERLRSFGGRSSLEVMMERAAGGQQELRGDAMDIDDGASEAGNSDFSEIIVNGFTAGPTAAYRSFVPTPTPIFTNPPLPEPFKLAITSCDVPKINAIIGHLDDPSRRVLMESVDAEGNLAVHILAAEAPLRFRRVVEEMGELGHRLCIDLVALTTPEGGLRNLRNAMGLTPLARSVIADVWVDDLRCELFRGAMKPPDKSAMTVAMEDAGMSVVGVDGVGCTVIHGAVKTWLACCARYWRGRTTTDVQVCPERIASAIAYFVECGVDINLRDSYGLTALDKLIAKPGSRLGKSHLSEQEEFLEWDAFEMRELNQKRNLLIGFLQEMGALTGLMLDAWAERRQNGESEDDCFRGRRF